ncbi:MAG TPA: amino acid adenylation domain-containing protein [Rubrivivax sp.]|nr:amino acid adenylation domain-containing protein [Rubrivivax sp.]
MSQSSLQGNFEASARRTPEQLAVVDPGVGSVSYRELDALANGVRDRLRAWGVQPGDRVGLCLRKSIDSVAVLLGALKAGAAYVPVDAGAPAARSAYILHDCRVEVVVLDLAVEAGLRSELERLGATARLLVVGEAPVAGDALREALAAQQAASPAAPCASVASPPQALAYILYTSGSTGKPKGVMLSQENATSFVDWCSEAFEPRADDRFSSHAPFHFDLSILDLHVCFKHGATLVLVNEDIGKDAPRLARLIAEQRISIWYSAPSILALLAQFGQLQKHHYPALRQVHFAGEVFAVKHLRALCEQWIGPRHFNLYGPTETNVCTFHEVRPPVPSERSTPYPIGVVCSHLRGRVLDEQGNDMPHGAEGELCIAGRGVMQGYWALPEQSARAFHVAPDGTRWYRTGDIVTEGEGGCFTYRGRRDRMVKRRGFRIELGEIEAGLYRHPAIKEAAVIAVADADAAVSIVAFLSWHGDKRPSLIEIKRFCAENLPLSMLPDRFSWHESLPKTSTDKVDYQRLKDMA